MAQFRAVLRSPLYRRPRACSTKVPLGALNADVMLPQREVLHVVQTSTGVEYKLKS